MAEILDIVDEQGRPTGQTVPRAVAHAEGIRHRTSHVWILRRHAGRVEVLLQMRCQAKDSFPGCYDISSAGHIPAGCDFVESALRELREELGVTLPADALQECGVRHFTFEDVCREVCEKLVFRHPNIFASSAAQNAGINGWDALKNKEKGRTTLADELNTVPATLPALMRAQKLQKRAVRCGVPEPEGTQAQQALQQAVDGWNAAQNADAAGELLFVAANAMRLAGVDAEEALTFASRRFCDACLQQEQRGIQADAPAPIEETK